MRHFEDLDLALYSKITKFETDADKQKQIIDVVLFAMEAVAEKLQEITIKYRDTKFHLSEAVKNYADIFNQLSAANQRNKELEATMNQVRRALTIR